MKEQNPESKSRVVDLREARKKRAKEAMSGERSNPEPPRISFVLGKEVVELRKARDRLAEKKEERDHVRQVLSGATGVDHDDSGIQWLDPNLPRSSFPSDEAYRAYLEQIKQQGDEGLDDPEEDDPKSLWKRIWDGLNRFFN